MSERDKLARLVFIADNTGAKDPSGEWDIAPSSYKEYAYRIADEVLAAGYAKGAGDE